MTRLVTAFYTLAEWITRFAYLNLLWLLFTVLGLGVFGLGPATSAMFTVMRKWVLGEDDIAVFKYFWKAYKKDFLKANTLMITLMMIGYFIYIEFTILRSQIETMYYVASFGVIVQMVLYLVVLTYFFSIYVHFDLKWMDYFKWPFTIGFLHPLMTIFLVLVTNLLLYVVYQQIPVLLLFFGGSLVSYILMWGAVKLFPMYEEKSDPLNVVGE